VRLLLDQNLSPLLVEERAARGNDVIHVRSLGMGTSSDLAILEAAARNARVVVSADTDFGDLLARTNAGSPSVFVACHYVPTSDHSRRGRSRNRVPDTTEVRGVLRALAAVTRKVSPAR